MSYWQEPDPDNETGRVLFFGVILIFGFWVMVFVGRLIFPDLF